MGNKTFFTAKLKNSSQKIKAALREVWARGGGLISPLYFISI